MIVLEPQDRANARVIPADEETVPAEAGRRRIRLLLGQNHVIISQRQAHTLRADLDKLKLDKTKE